MNYESSTINSHSGKRTYTVKEISDILIEPDIAYLGTGGAIRGGAKTVPNPRTVRKPLQSIWMCQRQRCRKMRYTLFCFGLNFSKRKTPQFLGITVFLVRQKGFEPPASPLGGARSIQLSY